LTRGHDRKLGGVASGLAEYFDIDPTLVRVLWVVALFVGPLGFGAVLAYLVLWVIMPAPQGDAPAVPSGSGGGRGAMDPSMLLGVVILALGLLLLMRSSWIWMPWFAWGGFSLFWPGLLIILGAFIIYSARQKA
jgi:phage shock protein PspC (stress-responsive transcriptional regulator)